MTLPLDIKNKLIDVIDSQMVTEGRTNVDIHYELEDAVKASGRNGWVSVMSGQATLDKDNEANSLDRYRFYWDYNILVGSGYQANPNEAEALSYQLARFVAKAIERNHTLGLGSQGVMTTSLVSITKTEGWPEEDRQTVLTVAVEVQCRGWPD